MNVRDMLWTKLDVRRMTSSFRRPQHWGLMGVARGLIKGGRAKRERRERQKIKAS